MLPFNALKIICRGPHSNLSAQEISCGSPFHGRLPVRYQEGTVPVQRPRFSSPKIGPRVGRFFCAPKPVPWQEEEEEEGAGVEVMAQGWPLYPEVYSRKGMECRSRFRIQLIFKADPVQERAVRMHLNQALVYKNFIRICTNKSGMKG